MEEVKSVYEGRIDEIRDIAQPGDDALTIWQRLLDAGVGGSLEERFADAVLLERGLVHELLLNVAHMEIMRRLLLARLTSTERACIERKRKEIEGQTRAKEIAVTEVKGPFTKWLSTVDSERAVMVAVSREKVEDVLRDRVYVESVWCLDDSIMGILFETKDQKADFVDQSSVGVVILDSGVKQIVDDRRRLDNENWREVVSVDCEMVGCQGRNRVSAVAVVDVDGQVLYEAVVRPNERVDDYRLKYSSITRQQVECGRNEEVVLGEVRDVLKGKIVVMHDSRWDLRVLPGLDLKGVIDTYQATRKSLQVAYKQVAGRAMVRLHDPVEDARAAMIVARAVEFVIDYDHWRQYCDVDTCARRKREDKEAQVRYHYEGRIPRGCHVKNDCRRKVEGKKRRHGGVVNVGACSDKKKRKWKTSGGRSRYRIVVEFDEAKKSQVVERIEAAIREGVLSHEIYCVSEIDLIACVASRHDVDAWRSLLSDDPTDRKSVV